MVEYNVDLSEVRSWDELIEAFNIGFMRRFGGEWTGNLDAFNDYLYWPDSFPYRLILDGWKTCHAALRDDVSRNGQPWIDVIHEILEDARDVEVIYC